MKKETKKAFNNITHNKLHLTFPNGNAISTIWGSMTYSDNYDYCLESEDYIERFGFEKFMSSDTCEIMILNAPTKLLKKIHRKYNLDSENSVIGYLNIKQWVEIITLLAK